MALRRVRVVTDAFGQVHKDRGQMGRDVVGAPSSSPSRNRQPQVLRQETGDENRALSASTCRSRPPSPFSSLRVVGEGSVPAPLPRTERAYARLGCPVRVEGGSTRCRSAARSPTDHWSGWRSTSARLPVRFRCRRPRVRGRTSGAGCRPRRRDGSRRGRRGVWESQILRSTAVLRGPFPPTGRSLGADVEVLHACTRNNAGLDLLAFFT